MPCRSRCRPASSRFTSAIPARTGSSVRSTRADQRSQPEFFGLDQTNDPDSKDDIVTAEMAIPVNREIHLLMHAKDVGHSFYVPELRVQQDLSRAWTSRSISPPPRSGSTKSFVRSFAAWGTTT